MRAAAPHPWKLSAREAMDVQLRLREKVAREDRMGDVRRVAGVDISVKDETAIAAVVILSFPGLEVIEQQVARRPVEFPYIPGLLAFREIPSILEAFEAIRNEPDLILVDGQGYAHPRRFGIACHLGVIVDTPTIGCAKSVLIGSYDEPAAKAGSHTFMRDSGEVVGAAVRTKDETNVVYVSIGHKVSLEGAIRWTLQCTKGYRLPEPTRLADRVAGGGPVRGAVEQKSLW